MDEWRVANAERIEVGMHAIAVICALGKPTKIKTLTSTREEWTYAKVWRLALYMSPRFKTIYLENGVVTDIR
jgi:hypothetical protein